MSRRRGTAVVGALLSLLAAALAAAGCGLGPGRGLGEARLTVTRDFGAKRVGGPWRDPVSESDTVMRLLERRAQITTRYGGGFVQSIDGIEAAERGDNRYDWFFYVNGVEAGVGAAAYALHGGDSVWWDYRDWSAAIAVPAVVGSWPQPFAGASEGRSRPVAIECRGGGAVCAEVRRRLDAAGARVRTSARIAGTSANAPGAPHGIVRVLVGPWARLRRDPAAAQIEAGPAASGVFAAPRRAGRSYELWGLDESGRPVRRFGESTGLVAATRLGESPPVWVVTGTDAAGVRAAAGLLDARDLRDHYAVVADGGRAEPLPLR